MSEHTPLTQLTPFETTNLDALVNQHFPVESWYSSDSLIEQYPEEHDTYADILPIFGSDDFEKHYGNDPIGCIYETHDGRIFFISYL